METIIFVAILAALALGVAFGVLIMCLFAMARLGEDELPQIDHQRFQD